MIIHAFFFILITSATFPKEKEITSIKWKACSVEQFEEWLNDFKEKTGWSDSCGQSEEQFEESLNDSKKKTGCSDGCRQNAKPSKISKNVMLTPNKKNGKIEQKKPSKADNDNNVMNQAIKKNTEHLTQLNNMIKFLDPEGNIYPTLVGLESEKIKITPEDLKTLSNGINFFNSENFVEAVKFLSKKKISTKFPNMYIMIAYYGASKVQKN